MTGDRTPKVPNSPPDPVIVSWSGLKRWENCRQHQLRTIQHKAKRSNMGRIFLPGTICDLTQRRFLESDNQYVGQMEDMVEDIFLETVEKGESRIDWRGDPRKDKEDVKALCREAVKRLEPWLWKEVLPYDYAPEIKFKAHFELPYVCDNDVRAPVILIGGIDLAVRRPNGKFRLYDLKITSNDAYMKTTLGQLTFYDLAWCIIQGEFGISEDWGFVAPLLEEFIVGVKVTQEDRRVMMSRIQQYAEGVWRDSWEPKADDKGCTWCEARGACDKFKTVPIVEANGKQKVSFAQAAAQRTKFRT